MKARAVGFCPRSLSRRSPVRLKGSHVVGRAQDRVANLVLREIAGLGHDDDPNALYAMGIVERVDHSVNAVEVAEGRGPIEDQPGAGIDEVALHQRFVGRDLVVPGILGHASSKSDTLTNGVLGGSRRARPPDRNFSVVRRGSTTRTSGCSRRSQSSSDAEIT